MLKAIFGKEKNDGDFIPINDPERPITGGGGQVIELTPEAFDAIFRGKAPVDG